METFAAAAVSLAIAIALVIRRKKSPLHLSFAAVCVVLAVEKFGYFSFTVSHNEVWEMVHYCGLLALPPLTVIFSRYLLVRGTMLSMRDIILAGVISVLLALSFFTPLVQWRYFALLLYVYLGMTLAYCYSALIYYIGEAISVTEKKRMIYVAIACAVALSLGITDVMWNFGYAVPALADIATAALLYFFFVITMHTDLPELYEIMLRALLIFLVILFVTTVFYGVLTLSGTAITVPFTGMLISSFVIVILIDPVKIVVKKVLSSLLYENKDFSAFLYPLEGDIERKDFSILEEMSTGFAHEIRNPLGSIKGAAQYLKTESDTPGNSKLLDIIIEETDRLNAAVSQFLNYAKPRLMNIEKQDINIIIRKVVSLIKTTNLPKGVIIEENLASDLPLVKVDGEQMIQVFLNLALNGIEAMPDGGTLSFSSSKSKDDGRRKVEITVHDTGRGVETGDAKAIFKPFYTTKKKGTGLGLPICQRIVKDHGGSLHVESLPGKGTMFFVRI